MSRPWFEMRASDEDRDRVNEVLQSAFAEGRLRPEEYEQRMSQVLNARTYGELAQLVTDLPGGAAFARPPASRSSGPPVPAVWGAPPPPATAMHGRDNKHATHALVAGLFGMVTLGITSAMAIIYGHRALREIRGSGESGYGRAVTGLILGYFWSAIWALGWLSAIFD